MAEGVHLSCWIGDNEINWDVGRDAGVLLKRGAHLHFKFCAKETFVPRYEYKYRKREKKGLEWVFGEISRSRNG